MAKRKRTRTLGIPTTRDFVDMAQILCRNSASASLVDDVTRYFASKNPRFDEDRFRAAASCRRK